MGSPMPRIAVVFARTDALCARLNGGLMAVALVLTVLTAALSMVRSAEWMADPDGQLVINEAGP
jgi:hypothetical protein